MNIKLPDAFESEALADNGFEVELEMADGSTPRDPETGAALYAITVLGMDSKKYQAAHKRNLNKRLQKRNAKLTAENLEEEANQLLAEVTVSWRGFVDNDGKPVECNRENALQLYLRSAIIKAQVDTAVADRANFTKASLTA